MHSFTCYLLQTSLSITRCNLQNVTALQFNITRYMLTLELGVAFCYKLKHQEALSKVRVYLCYTHTRLSCIGSYTFYSFSLSLISLLPSWILMVNCCLPLLAASHKFFIQVKSIPVQRFWLMQLRAFTKQVFDKKERKRNFTVEFINGI